MKKIGIVGLPGSGKTTIFNILAAGPRRQETAHLPVVVAIPDSRLEKLTEIFRPPKSVPGQLEFLEASNIKFDFDSLRKLDGLIIVLRAFGSEFVPLPEAGIDPARDFRIIRNELLLADLEAIEKRLEKLTKERSRAKIEEEKEIALLETCRSHLEKELPLSHLLLREDQERSLSGFRLVSRLPLLVAVNIGEEEIGKFSEAEFKQKLSGEGPRLITCSARFEEELSELDEKERLEFGADLAGAGPARERLIRAACEELNLISFFTISDKEIRAWPISRGTRAREAAGAVHSDMEKGFIRAEAINFSEFIECGSYEEAKKQGRLRLEGKDYLVADGDLIKFRFSV